MSDSEAQNSLLKAQERILSGAIRDRLGLKTEDLRLGLKVAYHLLSRGAKQEALRMYSVIVLCEPTNPEFQLGLANCAMQMGDHHLALQAASATIAFDARNARGYYISGRSCLALGYRAEAEEDLMDAVSFGRASKDSNVVEEAEKLLKQLAATQVNERGE